MAVCYYDGKYAPMEECSLPLTDLAIQRGVGAFESIRIYDGTPFAMTMHLDRLAGSVAGAGIEAAGIIGKLPGVIRGWLAQEENRGFDGLAKPYITGGDVNNRGVFPNPRFFVIFEDSHGPTPEEREKGVVLVPNHTARPFPLIKSTNYLFGFIPLGKAEDAKFESLYITPEGEVTESMSSNFFICKEGKIVTAPVGKVLKGVTRDIILTLAAENGFKVEERCPRESELAEADEAFITGSVKEVLPVVRVGAVKIGNGRPGPVAQALRHLFVKNKGRWMDK
ncbi:aminotransferase class IV [Synergistes jonesii]|uniref:aminotransferase class IV n=1 Tax=Synergistes jonesii TaxID=2754 RepID=UPI003333BDE5